jgi:hypothetical protein
MTARSRQPTHQRKFLTTSEAREGLEVLYAGDPTGPLVSLHPGVISQFHGPGLNHCVVAFVGVPDGPEGFPSGFDHEKDGVYPGLLLPESRADWASLVMEVSATDFRRKPS